MGNRTVLDMADRLTEAYYREERDGSYGSIRDTLIHVLNAPQIWIARARQTSPPVDLAPDSFPTVSLLRHVWNDVDGATLKFVSSLDECSLGTVIHYLIRQEQPNTYPCWQLLVHPAMHAAQHRSEVALRLTQLGYSPGWLDFLYFLDPQATSSPVYE